MVISVEDVVDSANPEIPKGEREDFLSCKPIIGRPTLHATPDGVDIGNVSAGPILD